MVFVKTRTDFPNNRQNVHTPWELAREMLGQLEKATPFQDRTFLVLNLEFVEVLCYDFGVAREKVWFVTDCQQKANVLKHERYAGVNVVVTDDYLSWKPNMKFDVIVGNPPYQENVDNTYAVSLWDKFAIKAFELLAEGGYLSLVHPGGWRNNGGKFQNVSDNIRKNNLKFLKIFSAKESMNMFGVETKVDSYVVQKSPYSGKTQIVWMNGEESIESFLDFKFIPNGNDRLLSNLIAAPNEERVRLITTSKYATSKKHLFKLENSPHKVLSLVRKDGSIEYKNCSVPIDAKILVPKVVWSNTRLTSLGVFIDLKGEYGLTQFCYGISDIPSNLPLIAAAMNTVKFKRLMDNCILTAFPCLNLNVFELFKRDFWRHFVDNEGNPL